MRPLPLLRLLWIPGLLTGFGVAFCVSPEAGRFSSVENRPLASPPRCDGAERWFDGTCAREIDLYVSDHFPAREQFVGAAFWMKEHRGVRDDTPRVVEVRSLDEGWIERLEDWAPLDGGEPEEAEEPLPDAGPLFSSTEIHATEIQPAAFHAGSDGELLPVTLAATGVVPPDAGVSPDAGVATAVRPAPPRPSPRPAEGKATLSNGILVHGNRAMQLFGAGRQSAVAYARVINAYAERLAGRVRVHSVVVPTAVSFHLPPGEARRGTSEHENLLALAGALRPDVLSPDVFPALAAHAQEEPLYLRTDHHWNGLGAFRAYESFCSTAGLSPLPLSAFKHGQRGGFVGSLAAFTQDTALRAAPDVVDHYEPPVQYTALRFAAPDGSGPGVPMRFVEPRQRGYLVFLGGDAPVMVARTEVNNGRRAILVKNSYGNPFAPLLLPHFEQVTVVDYRYFSGSLDALVESTQATDLIFFNVTLLANAAPHRTRLAQLGRGARAWTLGPSKRPDAGTPGDAGATP
ncbi:MAG: hypothetical protein RL653_3964 [Pseudomonadota bacterium]|jgi:hypothetical protein